MKVEVERLPKKGVKLKISIEAEKVSQTQQHVIEEMVQSAELPGFRKGTAPRSLVEPQLDLSKIRGEVVNHLVPAAYDQAIKENLIKPIVLPKIEVVSYEDGQELSFTATTCEAPAVSLGDYKSQITNLKNQINEPKILLGPDGQPIKSSNAKSDTEPEQGKVDKIFEILLSNGEIEIPDILIEDEVARMLGRLIDQTGRLGISVEQYLESVDKTIDDLKKEYWQTAEKGLKLEFILLDVARQEGLKVEESEISATIMAAPDEGSRQNLTRTENKVYLESILLKNKVVQKLLEYSK